MHAAKSQMKKLKQEAKEAPPSALPPFSFDSLSVCHPEILPLAMGRPFSFDSLRSPSDTVSQRLPSRDSAACHGIPPVHPKTFLLTSDESRASVGWA